MSTASAREFALPRSARLASVAEALAEQWRRTGQRSTDREREEPHSLADGHRDVSEHQERRTELTVLDSFDGLLYEAGLACLWDEGRLAVLDRRSGAEHAWVPVEAPTRRLFAHELPEGRVRALLAPVLEQRALLPLARLSGRGRGLDLLDAERKTVVRVRLEEPRRLLGRVRVLPLRGYDEEAAQVCRLLEHELGLAPASTLLIDEAVQAEGHPPAGVSAKVRIALEPGQRADAAAATVLRTLLEVIEANLPGSVEDLDTEFLHDLRVSVRRSRAVQRELKGVFPPDLLHHFRGEFRWLQRVTGEARDLDVYVQDFEEMRALVPAAMGGDLDPLRAVLAAHRARAHEELAVALRSARVRTLLSDWRAFLDGLPERPAAERPDAARPVEEVAAQRIAKVYRRMVKMGAAIRSGSDPEEYHELRKKGKELRYLLELFGAPLFPEDVVGPMIKTLKSLQDVLGRHQDREVQQATLGSLREELMSAPDGDRALLATGALLLRLAEDEQAARADFAERFSAFSAKGQRRLVKQVFG